MHPYVIAISDSERRLVTQTRFASSIDFLTQKLALSLGDTVIGIRRFDYEEVDAYECAAHVAQISDMIPLVCSSAPRQLAKAFLILIDTGKSEPPISIVRFGESLLQCLRTFTPHGLADFGAGAQVIAIRQITDNEIEELVYHSLTPKF